MKSKSKRMPKWLFYMLVVIAVALLVIAIISKDIIVALQALLLALLLKPYSSNIPLPDVYLRQIGMERQDVSVENLREMAKTEKKKMKKARRKN